MRNFVEEFRSFAVKGNVVDLAVAVVIGTAFGKIVSSFVANIVTPLIGLVMGGIDLSQLSFQVREAEVTYGYFLQSVIDFVVIALAIFLAIKLLNRAKHSFWWKAEKEAAEAKEETPEDIKLLREIRDSLKQE